MKKIVSALLVITLVLACSVSLVSCLKILKGTYVAGSDGANTSYTFDGKGGVTVGVKVIGVSTSYEGTYELNKDKTEITISYNKLSGTHSLEFGDGFILIDGIKYEKQ